MALWKINTRGKGDGLPKIVMVNRCFIFDDDGNLLLVKRSSNDRHYPGFWEVPGGKIDEGQDLESSLEREVMEETGLEVELASELVSADSSVVTSGPYNGMTYVVMMCIGKVQGGTLQLSDEHEDCKWVSQEEAYECDITPEVRKAFSALQPLLRS